MKGIAAKLKKHSAEIGSAAAIIGLLVAILGFCITIWQLQETRRTLQASNAYEIQRDARALIDSIVAEGELQKLLKGEELSAASKEKVKESLWQMNNFYLSIFRQGEAGGIPDDFVTSFSSDFCSFTNGKAINKLWDEMLKENAIGKSHMKMREGWC